MVVDYNYEVSSHTIQHRNLLLEILLKLLTMAPTSGGVNLMYEKLSYNTIYIHHPVGSLLK